MISPAKLKPNEKCLSPLVDGRANLGCPEIEYVQIEADPKEVALRLKRAYAVLCEAVMEKRKLDSMRQELA